MLQKDKGQILVITLLILIIMSVIVLSTVVNLTRDIEQTINNELYEENYSFAEASLLDIQSVLDEAEEKGQIELSKLNFGPNANLPANTSCGEGVQNSLKDFLTLGDNVNDAGNPIPTEVSCDTTDNSTCRCSIEQQDKVTTAIIEVRDDIRNLQMTSNDALQLKLEPNTGGSIDIVWNNSNGGDTDIVWSVGLIGQVTNGGYYEIWKGVFDSEGDGSFGGEFADNTIFPTQQANSTRMTIDLEKFTAPASAVGNPEFIRLRPVNTGSIEINIDSSSASSFPNQFIELKAQTYTNTELTTPTPLLSIKRPIWPSLPGIYDYVYYTNKGITAQ